MHRFFINGSSKRATLRIYEETSAITCVAVTNRQTLPTLLELSNMMFSASMLFKVVP